ncbi:MAG: LamG domain-containing protein, partial [Pseudomonadales bacterium]|nr:LamG domain-containing protein [Pseudomonadales bacterium]
MNIFQKIALGIFFALAAMASSADFITPTAVTASSFGTSTQTPNNLINSSGLSANNAAGTHDADDYANTMWVAGAGAPLSCKVSDTPFLTLDGTNDYIALNMSYTGKNIAELTVEAWVKTTYSSSENFNNWAIVDFDRSEFYNLFVAGNGQVGFSTHSHANGNIKDFYSGSEHTVNDVQWHHIAGVYDGTDKIIYIDGVEVARQVNPHSGADLGKNNLTRWGFIGDGSEAASFNANRNN